MKKEKDKIPYAFNIGWNMMDGFYLNCIIKDKGLRRNCPLLEFLKSFF